MTFTLPSTAGTGYSWSVVGDLPPCVVQVGEVRFIADQVDTLGSGGKSEFTFKGVSKVHGSIRFEYARSWEKDVKAARWAVMDLTIK